MLNKKPWLLAICAIFALQACQPDEQRELPDVSDIEVEVPLYRFEQELFALDTTRLDTGLEALEEKYPVFGQIYFERILGSKDPMTAPEGHVAFMRGFAGRPAILGASRPSAVPQRRLGAASPGALDAEKATGHNRCTAEGRDILGGADRRAAQA